VSPAATELAGQLQSGLVGLGSTVAEEHLTDRARRLLQQFVDLDGRLGDLVGGEQVADVHQRGRLLGDDLVMRG
jgi:hypothetical protein